MQNRRNQFTFYASYYDAIQHLKKQDQLAVIMAICAYALDGTDPKLTGAAASAFILIKPTLDTSRRKAESGKRGGSAKQEASKVEANGKQSAREKEKEKEKEKEGEIEIEEEYECTIPPTPLSGRTHTKPAKGMEVDPVEEELSRLSPDLRTAMEKWLKYKKERREAYKATGLSALVSKVINEAQRFGEQAVVDVVEKSMASNYAGILFDRLSSGNQQKPAQNRQKPGGNVFLELLEDEA